MTSSHPKIAISYRRNDNSAAYAGLIYARLTRYFPTEDIFLDVASLVSGTDFPSVIQNAFYGCQVLIVVIGDEWEIRKHDGKKLLMDKNDWVRKELETAFGHTEGKPLVIPVLVNRRSMPILDDVPLSLYPLLEKHAESLSHESFRKDTDQIVTRLYRHIYNHEDLIDIVTQDQTGGIVGIYNYFNSDAIKAVEKEVRRTKQIRIMQTWITHIATLSDIIDQALENNAEAKILVLETDEKSIRAYFDENHKNIHVKERAVNLNYDKDEGIREIEHITEELKKL